MYQNFFDSHTHTNHSPDAFDLLENNCRSAIQKGMKGFAVTDHFECNEYDVYKPVAKASFEDVQQAKERYGGKLVLTAGVELGQPLQNLSAAEETLALYDYDFVLGSLHNNAGLGDYYCIDYATVDVYALLTAYYEQLLEMAKWNRFDIMAHITYPLRYMVGDHGIKVDMSRFQEVIDEIFRTLIKNHKGIEINTSGLRQNIGCTMPDLPLVKRYRELGGEIITIGSDAHTSADLGSGIEQGMNLLKEAGFRYVAFFQKREPKMFPIV